MARVGARKEDTIFMTIHGYESTSGDGATRKGKDVVNKQRDGQGKGVGRSSIGGRAFSPTRDVDMMDGSGFGFGWGMSTGRNAPIADVEEAYEGQCDCAGRSYD